MKNELERLDINLLLLLHWLCVEKSVTQAAARMGISQPAASRGLRKLREIFRDELFVRSGRSIIPTKLAEMLAPQLEDAQLRLRAIVRSESDFDPETFSETVSIASNDYLGSVGSGAWSSGVVPFAPLAQANWRPLEASVIDNLVSGGIDLVLSPYAAQPNIPESAVLQDVVVRPFFTDRFVVFGAKTNSLLLKKTMTVQEFANADHIMVSPTGSGDGIVDVALRTLGFRRFVRHRTASFSHAAHIAVETDCLAVLPEGVAALRSDGAYCSPPLKLPAIPSFIAWHSSRTNEAAHKWIRQQLVSHISNSPLSEVTDAAQ